MVAVGTPVTIVDQTAKVAWRDGALWLEVHPSGAQADAIEDRRPPPPRPIDRIEALVSEAARRHLVVIDWETVRQVATERRGYPVRISR
jgi:L,D-transpeptidase ErfK/SrfK